MTSVDSFASLIRTDSIALSRHRLDGPLPLGWRVLADDSTGLVYFVNDQQRTTSWTDPR